MHSDLNIPDATRHALREIAGKYLWWGQETHSAARMAAQVMNLGTYDDILRLEGLLGSDALVRVMTAAEPGWFSERSWEFWRGRLRCEVAPSPPVRVFDRGF